MNYYWIKFPLAEIHYFLDTYSQYSIAVLDDYGYVFRDAYEMSCFCDENKKAILIVK